MAQRVAAAHQSAGRDRNVTVTSRGVVDSDDDEVSATSVVDLTDNDLFLSRLPMSVQQETVNQDSVNHILDGGVHFSGQEMVNEDSINHISDGGVDSPRQEKVNAVAESNGSPQDRGVCRSGRNKTPREMYVPSMQDKSYANEKYDGVGFSTAKKRLSEGEELENQFAGAGYCTKRGVINLNMQGIAPPPKMTES